MKAESYRRWLRKEIARAEKLMRAYKDVSPTVYRMYYGKYWALRKAAYKFRQVPI